MKLVYFYLMVSLIYGVGFSQERAVDIIKKSDDLMRGKTMVGKYKMTIARPEWQRSMEFKFWSEGTEKSFMLMLKPAKDKGVTFLKIGREMWNYIPKINREIKIPPSMMLQSWMGSDFTNDDLVKESSIVTDYTHKFLGEEEEAGFMAFKLELTPKPDAPVVWDKLIEWIRKDDYVPLKVQYFNERGELIRTMIFSDIKKIGDRVYPAKMELLESKKPGNSTILILSDATFDRAVKKSVFTKQNLKRAKP